MTRLLYFINYKKFPLIKVYLPEMPVHRLPAEVERRHRSFNVGGKAVTDTGLVTDKRKPSTFMSESGPQHLKSNIYHLSSNI